MERATLLEMLRRVRSRGEVKRLGQRVDRDPAVRRALVRLATERGFEGSDSWPGKKLVRALRPVRELPPPTIVRRDEAFECLHCGRQVAPGGRRVRDHCPYCLRGRHLDVVPGDRAADCGGKMHPVRFEVRASVVWIGYACEACGYEWRVRAHDDDELPVSLSPNDLV